MADDPRKLDPRIMEAFLAEFGQGVNSANEKAAFEHLQRRFTEGPELSESLWGAGRDGREQIVDYLRKQYRTGQSIGETPGYPKNRVLSNLRAWYETGPSEGQRGDPTYVARRLANTEAAFYYQAIDDAMDLQLEEAGLIDGYEILLSPEREDWPCDCPTHAANSPYPTLAETPAPPYHPLCMCRRRPIFGGERKRKRKKQAQRIATGSLKLARDVAVNVAVDRAYEYVMEQVIDFIRALMFTQRGAMVRDLTRTFVSHQIWLAREKMGWISRSTVIPEVEQEAFEKAALAQAKQLKAIANEVAEEAGMAALPPVPAGGGGFAGPAGAADFDRKVRELLKDAIKGAKKYDGGVITYKPTSQTFTAQQILEDLFDPTTFGSTFRVTQADLTVWKKSGQILKPGDPKLVDPASDLAQLGVDVANPAARPVRYRVWPVTAVEASSLGGGADEVLLAPGTALRPFAVREEDGEYVIDFREVPTWSVAEAYDDEEIDRWASDTLSDREKQRVRRDWRHIFPIAPQQVAEHMMFGLDTPLTGMSIDADMNGVRISLQTDDFTLTRRFVDTGDGIVVRHDSFKVTPDAQGQGIARRVLTNSVYLYEGLGFREIQTIATSRQGNIGGYVWPRFGFVPDELTWRNLKRENIRPWLAAHADDVPQDDRIFLEMILDRDDPEALLELADHRMGFAILSQEGVDYRAVLDLREPSRMQVFNAYTRRLPLVVANRDQSELEDIIGLARRAEEPPDDPFPWLPRDATPEQRQIAQDLRDKILGAHLTEDLYLPQLYEAWNRLTGGVEVRAWTQMAMGQLGANRGQTILNPGGGPMRLTATDIGSVAQGSSSIRFVLWDGQGSPRASWWATRGLAEPSRNSVFHRIIASRSHTAEEFAKIVEGLQSWASLQGLESHFKVQTQTPKQLYQAARAGGTFAGSSSARTWLEGILNSIYVDRDAPLELRRTVGGYLRLDTPEPIDLALVMGQIEDNPDLDFWDYHAGDQYDLLEGEMYFSPEIGPMRLRQNLTGTLPASQISGWHGTVGTRMRAMREASRLPEDATEAAELDNLVDAVMPPEPPTPAPAPRPLRPGHVEQQVLFEEVRSLMRGTRPTRETLREMRDEWDGTGTTLQELEDAFGSGRFSPGDEDHWERLVDMRPQQFVDYLYQFAPPDLVGEYDWSMDVSSRSIDFELKTDGGHGVAIERMERTLYPQQGYASHNFLRISRSGDTGKGLGRAIFSAFADIYQHMGIQTVNVSAGLSAGGYTWARFGFRPNTYDPTETFGRPFLEFLGYDEDAIEDRARESLEATDRYAELKEMYLEELEDEPEWEERFAEARAEAEEVGQSVEELEAVVREEMDEAAGRMADDTFDDELRQLARDPDFLDQFYAEAATDEGLWDWEEQEVLWNIADHKRGRDFLSGQSWDGTLDLDEDRFNNYVNRGEVHDNILDEAEDLAQTKQLTYSSRAAMHEVEDEKPKYRPVIYDQHLDPKPVPIEHPLDEVETLFLEQVFIQNETFEVSTRPGATYSTPEQRRRQVTEYMQANDQALGGVSFKDMFERLNAIEGIPTPVLLTARPFVRAQTYRQGGRIDLTVSYTGFLDTGQPQEGLDSTRGIQPGWGFQMRQENRLGPEGTEAYVDRRWEIAVDLGSEATGATIQEYDNVAAQIFSIVDPIAGPDDVIEIRYRTQGAVLYDHNTTDAEWRALGMVYDWAFPAGDQYGTVPVDSWRRVFQRTFREIESEGVAPSLDDIPGMADALDELDSTPKLKGIVNQLRRLGPDGYYVLGRVLGARMGESSTLNMQLDRAAARQRLNYEAVELKPRGLTYDRDVPLTEGQLLLGERTGTTPGTLSRFNVRDQDLRDTGLRLFWADSETPWSQEAQTLITKILDTGPLTDDNPTEYPQALLRLMRATDLRVISSTSTTGQQLTTQVGWLAPSEPAPGIGAVAYRLGDEAFIAITRQTEVDTRTASPQLALVGQNLTPLRPQDAGHWRAAMEFISSFHRVSMGAPVEVPVRAPELAEYLLDRANGKLDPRTLEEMAETTIDILRTLAADPDLADNYRDTIVQTAKGLERGLDMGEEVSTASLLWAIRRNAYTHAAVRESIRRVIADRGDLRIMTTPEGVKRLNVNSFLESWEHWLERAAIDDMDPTWWIDRPGGWTPPLPDELTIQPAAKTPASGDLFERAPDPDTEPPAPGVTEGAQPATRETAPTRRRTMLIYDPQTLQVRGLDNLIDYVEVGMQTPVVMTSNAPSTLTFGEFQEEYLDRIYGPNAMRLTSPSARTDLVAANPAGFMLEASGDRRNPRFGGALVHINLDRMAGGGATWVTPDFSYGAPARAIENADGDYILTRWTMEDSVIGTLLHELGHAVLMPGVVRGMGLMGRVRGLDPSMNIVGFDAQRAPLLEELIEMWENVDHGDPDQLLGFYPSGYPLSVHRQGSKQFVIAVNELLAESFTAMYIDSERFFREYPDLARITYDLTEIAMEENGWVFELPRPKSVMASNAHMVYPQLGELNLTDEPYMTGQELQETLKAPRPPPDTDPGLMKRARRHGTGLGYERFFSGLAGHFGEHIDNSIPNYAPNRVATAKTLAEILPAGSKVIDVGASEGQFGKAIGMATDGEVRVHNVDPNPNMQRAWEDFGPGPGNTYEVAAWVEGFRDDENGIDVPAFKPQGDADIVHMSMVRQFVTDDARPWYAEVKKALKPDGVFVNNVKVIAGDNDPEWVQRESQKDDYKRQFFTADEITRKAEETLVGMHQLMLTKEQELAALRAEFKYVQVYWESYNFYGFVASDSKEAIARFMEVHADHYRPDYQDFQPPGNDFGLVERKITPADKMPLYHGTSIDAALGIKDMDLVPSVGQIVLESYEDWPGEELTKLVFLAPPDDPGMAVTYALWGAVQHHGLRTLDDLTLDHVRTGAALVISRNYDTDYILRMEEDTGHVITIDGELTDHEQPKQVETPDLFSFTPVAADEVLTGERLIKWLRDMGHSLGSERVGSYVFDRLKALSLWGAPWANPPKRLPEAPLFESLPPEIVGDVKHSYKVDNPLVTFGDSDRTREWLSENPTTPTAWFNGTEDPAVLSQFPGQNNEHLRIDDDQARERIELLKRSIREDGYRATAQVMVRVSKHGRVTIWEGNHRIRAAVELGMPRIPVEVFYEGGAEQTPGIWQPTDLRNRPDITDITGTAERQLEPATVAAKLRRYVERKGGATYSVLYDRFHEGEGYAVSLGEEYGLVISDENYGEDTLRRYVKTYQEELSRGDRFVGLYQDQQKFWHLDISEVKYDRNAALQAARERNQISIWDFSRGDEIMVGGTGGRLADDLRGLAERRMAPIDSPNVRAVPLALLPDPPTITPPAPAPERQIRIVHLAAKDWLDEIAPRRTDLPPVDEETIGPYRSDGSLAAGAVPVTRWVVPTGDTLVPYEQGAYLHAYTTTIPMRDLHTWTAGSEVTEAQLAKSGFRGIYYPPELDHPLRGQVRLFEAVEAALLGKLDTRSAGPITGETLWDHVFDTAQAGSKVRRSTRPVATWTADGWQIDDEKALAHAHAAGAPAIYADARGPIEQLDELDRYVDLPDDPAGSFGGPPVMTDVAIDLADDAAAFAKADVGKTDGARKIFAVEQALRRAGLTPVAGMTADDATPGVIAFSVPAGTPVISMTALQALAPRVLRLVTPQAMALYSPSYLAAEMGYGAIAMAGRYTILAENAVLEDGMSTAIISGSTDTLERIRTTEAGISFRYLQYRRRR